MRQNISITEKESQVINAALYYLHPKSAFLSQPQEFDSYGGYPLHFPFQQTRKQQTGKLWAQFEEVEIGGVKQVARVLTRGGLNLVGEQNKQPKILIDNRPNIARELDSSLFLHRELLRLEYMKLLSGKLDAIVSPIRFGALQGFIEDNHRFDEKRWDIEEEKLFAEMVKKTYLGEKIRPSEFWNTIQVPNNVLIHAMIGFWSSEQSWKSQTVIPFATMDSMQLSVPEPTDLGREFLDKNGLWEQKITTHDGKTGIVEHCVAYPFPTEEGLVWCRLFRVWDEKKTRYDVVRTVQTQPVSDLSVVPELRIDSNCTNGVHALDGHCDCHLQLRELVKTGIEKNIHCMIVQMDDHEGKAHGEVWKGATLYVQRGLNLYLKSRGMQTIGNPTASKLIYSATDQKEDLRDYDAATLVMQAIGIKTIENARTGNSAKLAAMKAAGLEVLSSEAVNVTVNPETAVSIQEKLNGGVNGVSYVK